VTPVPHARQEAARQAPDLLVGLGRRPDDRWLVTVRPAIRARPRAVPEPLDPVVGRGRELEREIDGRPPVACEPDDDQHAARP